MRILALEADPAQAAMIRHVAHDMVNADVTVVDSLDRALRTVLVTPDITIESVAIGTGGASDHLAIHATVRLES